MAIYHLSIKVFSRGKGASSVAAAAYRAAEFIRNEYNGIASDYTHKGGVVHKEILLPENAPPEYADRAVLWNAVEMGDFGQNCTKIISIRQNTRRKKTHEGLACPRRCYKTRRKQAKRTPVGRP